MSNSQLVEQVMGTVVTVDVAPNDLGAGAVGDLLTAVLNRLRRVDDRFSTYKSDSEVSRFGRGELSEDEISDEFRSVLDLCAKLYSVTDGYFDIYAAAQHEPVSTLQSSILPDARPIEPSGAVKGWAIQQAVDILQAGGLRDFCINIGGDVYASGRPLDRDGWRIGLQHPYEKDKVMAVLQLSDFAVATSGLYERGNHIVVPGQGDAAELVSLSVIGPDITLADAYATAGFAMGKKGIAWVSSQPGFEVFAVDRNRVTLQSPGLDTWLAN